MADVILVGLEFLRPLTEDEPILVHDSLDSPGATFAEEIVARGFEFPDFILSMHESVTDAYRAELAGDSSMAYAAIYCMLSYIIARLRIVDGDDWSQILDERVEARRAAAMGAAE